MIRKDLLKTAKPIIFSTPMVEAILEDKKTVARRVIRFPEGTTGRLPESGATDYIYYPGGIKRPPYKVGDILYVRETFRYVTIGEETYEGEGIWSDEVAQFKASEDEFYEEYSDLAGEYGKWKPPVAMPKALARLFLRVTDVKVERLQDITGHEVEEEGLLFVNNPFIYQDPDTFNKLAHDEYSKMWDSRLSKKDLLAYGWRINPYVWVIDFERMNEVEN